MAEQIIRTTVSTLSAYLAANLPGTIPTSTIATFLTNFNAASLNNSLPLSSIAFDYEANLNEGIALLSATNEWRDLVVSGVGQTLLRFIATGQTMNQYGIEKALQEAMIDTAILPNSIYTITRMLGVRLARRRPASLKANFTYSGDTTSSFAVPQYSTFSVGGISYFNRDVILFSAGSSTTTGTLYEGVMNTTTLTSDGSAYQTYKFGNNDFTISDDDIYIKVDGVYWTRTPYTANYSLGLWNYLPTDTVFFESTDTSGNVVIIFGNNINGQIPNVGATITVNYAQTNGLLGNVDVSSAAITCSLYSKVSGTVVGPSVGGQNERSASEYKTLSPGAYSAKHAPSTLAEYRAYAVQYPGVIDAYIRNQQQIAPFDLHYMMALEITVLSTTAWLQADWDGFIAYMKANGIANMQIIQKTPTPIIVNPIYNVYCKDQVPLNEIQQLINSNLISLFAPRFGILGYAIYLSDIDNAVKSAEADQIVYFQRVGPTQDIVLQPWQYAKLGTATINMINTDRNS